MPQIVKTEKRSAGYACDMCGAIISDGEHDGMDGVNWWGLSLDIVPKETEVVTIEREWRGYTVRIRDKESPITRYETWGLCVSCADKVRQFITSNVKVGGPD